MQTRQKLIIVSMCAVFILSCKMFSPSAAPSVNPGDTTTESKAQTPESTALESEAQTPESTPLPEGLKSFFLPDPSTGLSQLESYRQQLAITYRGEAGGKAAYEQYLYTHDFDRKSGYDFSRQTAPGEDGQPVETLRGSLGGAQYYRLSAADPCSAYWD
ncbi:MAG TPA: hypothetical protein VN203_12260, partial [Candidatus Acidoferrum sp.]|nr:hypothetical protein [Candidatus Acidoferrum sp.]